MRSKDTGVPQAGKQKAFCICLFLVVIFSGAVAASAQETGQGIRGTIRDSATTEPLGNVNIKLLNTTRGAVSDYDGNFSIGRIDPGTYRIRISIVGYETVEETVSVSRGSYANLEVNLVPRIIQMGPAGIVGRRPVRNVVADPLVESGGLEMTKSYLSQQEIRKQGAITVMDALKFVPGGLTETRGRKVKQFFSVRGQKYPYPDYAIDGIWQKEFHEIPFFMTSADIEEIEVVRSSAALLTGLSGLAGVIKLTTREYDSLVTSAQAEYGSFGTFHGHLTNGARIGKFNYAVSAGYDRTDGPEGKHAAENMLNASGRIGWNPIPSLHVKANFYLLNGRQELALAEPPAAPRYQDMVQTYDRMSSTMANMKLFYHPSNRVSSELQLSYAARKPLFLDEVSGVTTEEYDYEWNLNFIQSVALSSTNVLRFGGLYNHWLAPEGKRFYTGRRCDTETMSFVVVDEQKIGATTVDAGIRWSRTFFNEYGGFNIEGTGGMFRNVDPIVNEWEAPVVQASLGAARNIGNDWSVHGHASAGQIKPREGTLDTALNAPANETRYKVDLGMIRQFRKGGRLVLTPFLVKQDNAIVYSGDSYEHPETGLIMELYENRDQEQAGVELLIQTPVLWDLVSVFCNSTVMGSWLVNDAGRTRNREHPAIIGNAGFYLEKSGFDLNVFGKYVSAFENDRFARPADGPQPLGDYFTVDLTGGYTFPWETEIRLYMQVVNLTDQRYSTVVGYPDFGRRIKAGINLVF